MKEGLLMQIVVVLFLPIEQCPLKYSFKGRQPMGRFLVHVQALLSRYSIAL